MGYLSAVGTRETSSENKQLCFIEGKTHRVLDTTIPICKHNADRMTCCFRLFRELQTL